MDSSLTAVNVPLRATVAAEGGPAAPMPLALQPMEVAQDGAPRKACVGYHGTSDVEVVMPNGPRRMRIAVTVAMPE